LDWGWIKLDHIEENKITSGHHATNFLNPLLQTYKLPQTISTGRRINQNQPKSATDFTLMSYIHMHLRLSQVSILSTHFWGGMAM